MKRAITCVQLPNFLNKPYLIVCVYPDIVYKTVVVLLNSCKTGATSSSKITSGAPMLGITQ